MSTDAKKELPPVLFSIKMSRRLSKALRKAAEHRGMSTHQFMVLCFEILLPIAQTEKIFRLAPTEFDFDTVPVDDKVKLSRVEADFVRQYAHESNLSVCQQLCQLLWAFLEFLERFERDGCLLRKEELSRLIVESLRKRWGVVH